MKTFRTTITKRAMHRTQRNGEAVVLDRYVLNYADPVTRKRKSQFFETRKEAEAEQQRLYKAVGEGSPLSPRQSPSVAAAVAYWLKHCEDRVLPQSLKSYREFSERYIIGPALVGTKAEKIAYTTTGKVPAGASLMPMLSSTRVCDLTTAQIRTWHQAVLKISTPYVARHVKKLFSTVLALVGEDFGIRIAPMPRRVSTGYRKKERILLRQDQVKALFDAAREDRHYGLYYVFLFLTGVRPGEMLGLLWEDVDFVANVIHIRRNQDKSGNIKPFPKTAAGQRTIPIVPSLRVMLQDWKERCPRREGYPHRVFPALGYTSIGPAGQNRAGGPLLLANFRHRLWKPLLRRLGLPPATPYVTRHLVISNLQAQGVEVGIVAKIAGHANPQVTLQHYTHQVRDNAGVMDKLNTAYGLN